MLSLLYSKQFSNDPNKWNLKRVYVPVPCNNWKPLAASTILWLFSYLGEDRWGNRGVERMLNPHVSCPTNQEKLAVRASNPCRLPPGYKSQRPPMVGLSKQTGKVGWAKKSVPPTDDRPQLADHRVGLQKTRDWNWNWNQKKKESKKAWCGGTSPTGSLPPNWGQTEPDCLNFRVLMTSTWYIYTIKNGEAHVTNRTHLRPHFLHGSHIEADAPPDSGVASGSMEAVAGCIDRGLFPWFKAHITSNI